MNSNLLHGLRDVEGVLGSFILSETGELLARDLPGIFDNDLFLEAGPRLTRLCDALSAQGEPLETAALRFAEHKLHLRCAQGYILCVLSSGGANPPALKMALSLLARRLESRQGELAAAGADRQSALPAAPASTAPGSMAKSSLRPAPVAPGTSGAHGPQVPGAARGTRTYRGRPID